MSAAVEWRPVEGFPGYEVGSNGEIRSWHLDRTTPRAEQALPRTLNANINLHGYRHVVLCRDGQRSTRTVHKLVVRAFAGPRPFPKAITRHLDGNQLNNSASNLAWGSHAENSADADRHGRSLRGERNHRASLSAAAVRDIRATRGVLTNTVLAARYNVTTSAIDAVRSGRTWRHVT